MQSWCNGNFPEELSLQIAIGDLKQDDDDGIENVGKKNDFAFFQA